jgi:hypothetical protein
MKRQTIAIVSALLLLVVAASAHAQSISTEDLAGEWSVYQLATPATDITPGSIRAYTGTVTFDGTGTVTSGTVTDDAFNTFTVTGSLTVSAQGLVAGQLTLDDGGGTTGLLDVAEARLLVSKRTIVGASTILDNPGLVTLVKLEAGQTFELNADVAGDWNYHEITPSNDQVDGDATWVRGSIRFHENDGCTAADLRLADGTVRASRPPGDVNSFL